MTRPGANVIIDGMSLSNAQVMTLRVALSSYLTDLVDRGPAALGEDNHGRAMTAAYLARGREVESMLIDGAIPEMSRHDRLRKERAEACDENDPASLAEAILGLQSTDHPSLLPLHDRLMARYRELKGKTS